MLAFIARRLAVMLATMLALTFVVFTLVNLEPNLRKLALEQNNNRMSAEAVDTWLEQEGYRRSLVVRYGDQKLDGSVSRKIGVLRAALHERASHEIHTNRLVEG